MELNVNDRFFAKARPIWAKGLEEEKNITLGLYKKISYEMGKAVLKVAVSGFYKVFLNGEFLYFGPSRCAHGYYRVDEMELPLKKGENHIAIETVNYYVNSFYSLMQKGFIEAEFTVDGEVFAATGDKDWLRESYAALVKEYKYWQTQRIAPDGLNVYGPHKDYNEEFIANKANYFTKRYKGFEVKSELEKIACAHTIMTMCESGWDCTSRFENAGEFYNPVDLNSLLYGLEKTMEKFAVILENGEEDLWSKRADERKAKMLELMYDKERGIFLDYNYKEQKFSPVVSAASLYPLFVGLSYSPEKAIELLSDKLLLKYGVSACVPGDYNYSLQWDYPNVWPPIQYIAYKACKNCGYDGLAKKIAETYINLLDESFAETGNLWEKYNGLTGKVANADYNAPKMMGWTAGVYMYFCAELKK